MKVIVFISLLAVAVIAEIELTSEEGASSRQGRSLFLSRSSLYAPAVQSSGCPACAPTVNIGYSDVFPIVVTSLDGEKPVCGWRFTYDGKKPPSITCSQFQLFPFYESLHIYDDAYSFTRVFAGVEGPVSLKFPASGVANVVLKRNGSNSPSSIQCIIAGGSPPACPAAFDAVGNTCIHVGDTGLSWDAAKTYCEGLNGHLAVISDLNTHQAISDYLTAAGAPEAVSIGARINAAGDYEWLDGTPLPATSLLWFIGNEITPEEGTSSRQGRFFFFLKKSQSTGCPACAPTINIGYTDVVPIVVSSFDGDKPLCGWKFTYDGKKPPSITCSQFQLFPFYESLHIYDDALTNRFIREYTGVQGPVSLTLPASGVANVVLRRSGTKLMSRIECTITGGGEPACPDPFVAVSNTCIHVGDTVASWDGAKTYCEGLNGQLAVLSDLNTHQAVADYLEAAGMPPGGREAGTRMQSSTGRKGTGVTDVARSWLRSPTARIPKFERPDEIFWIGARINAAGDLEWLDGTVLPATSLSWANGFPDGNLANECAALVEASNYKVANKACTDTGYHPLCQTAPI